MNKARLDNLNSILKKAIILEYARGFKEVLIPFGQLTMFFGTEDEDSILRILAGENGIIVKKFFRKRGYSIKRKAFNFSMAHLRVSKNSFIITYNYYMSLGDKVIVPKGKYIRMLVY